MYQLSPSKQALKQALHKRLEIMAQFCKMFVKLLQILLAALSNASRLGYAFVPQLVQEDSCKFSFVSSSLTEGFPFPSHYFRWRNWQRKFLTKTRLNVRVVHGRKLFALLLALAQKAVMIEFANCICKLNGAGEFEVSCDVKKLIDMSFARDTKFDA